MYLLNIKYKVCLFFKYFLDIFTQLILWIVKQVYRSNRFKNKYDFENILNQSIITFNHRLYFI